MKALINLLPCQSLYVDVNAQVHQTDRHRGADKEHQNQQGKPDRGCPGILPRIETPRIQFNRGLEKLNRLQIKAAPRVRSNQWPQYRSVLYNPTVLERCRSVNRRRVALTNDNPFSVGATFYSGWAVFSDARSSMASWAEKCC